MKLPSLLAATLVALPSVCVAQALQGRVVDGVTKQAISTVSIRLLKADVPVAEAVTDSAGRFVLQAREPGRYRLHATRLGYADATTPYIELHADQAVTAQLEMSAQPVKVAALTLTANRSRYLEGKGFYERQGERVGDFLTAEQIRRRNSPSLVDVLRTMRGIKI